MNNKENPIRLYLYGGGLILACLCGIWLQSTGAIKELLKYEADIRYLTVQHLWLVLLSGGLAVLFAVPLGVLISRPKFQRISEGLMQFLNIGSTIPTLAILALSMSLLGIGTVPAIFGLFVASLLPIARNTYVGIKEVPVHLKEAAVGIGMSPMQMLFKVEIPNALFVIFAGVRVAFSINVGTAPLAFLIGGGGLGELIFTGIDLNEMSMMLAGAITTSFLAIAIDMAIACITYFTIPKGVNPLRIH
ncbi:MAG: ABC transporter permease [Arenicella sp.]